MALNLTSFYLFGVLIFVSLIYSTTASTTKNPLCRGYTPMKGFDKTKFFTGGWYRTYIEKVNQSPNELCQKTNYEILQDGSINGNSQFYLDQIEGLANAVGPVTNDVNFSDGLAVYNWTFKFQINGKTVSEMEFSFPTTILDTDYNNYAILHSCQVFGTNIIDEFTIISRKKDGEPDPKIKEVLSKVDVDFDKFLSRKSIECVEDPNF